MKMMKRKKFNRMGRDRELSHAAIRAAWENLKYGADTYGLSDDCKYYDYVAFVNFMAAKIIPPRSVDTMLHF